MIDINEAAEMIEVNKKELVEFEIKDSFNNDNLLIGFLCKRSDHRYGCLILTKVNDEECCQVIYCTPKLKYPFDKKGNYNFPKCVNMIFYDKLDGTNVFSYRYKYRNKEFITFKTRIGPIIKNNKYGLLKSMWSEYYNSNNWIKEVIDLNPDYNLSFEMFGSRNEITIKYECPLEVNLLFGVSQKGHIIKPIYELKINNNTKIPEYILGYPSLNSDDIKNLYNEHRSTMSKINSINDEFIKEGLVQYCNIGSPSWVLFKCKPEEIEKIHWTSSGYLSSIILTNSALNVFESEDNPTIENFIELLKEEFSDEIIEKSKIKIEKCWYKVLQRVELNKQVNEVWILAKENGLDVTKDKAETMRFVSKYFPKNVMGKVGGTILKLAGMI